MARHLTLVHSTDVPEELSIRDELRALIIDPLDATERQAAQRSRRLRGLNALAAAVYENPTPDGESYIEWVQRHD